MAISALASRIDAVARLEGDFLLRSGVRSKEYFDKYRFEADPMLLREIAHGLAPMVPADTEVLAGLELGGVSLVTALSLELGIRAAFVRKVAKPYGTAKLAEGASVEGRRVVVVEDVVTSGGQVVASVGELRALGAVVDLVLCVIDREEGGSERLAELGIELRSLLRRRDLEAARSTPDG